MTKTVEVAAAVLLREGERGTEFLLARRPEGRVYAGYWEFPGGKVEPGETLRQALTRELHEELGIETEHAWPWLSCEFTYPHAHVRLKFFQVDAWRGELHAHEHSGLSWTPIDEDVDVAPILPANGPILRALTLPPIYAITNAADNGIDGELLRLEAALAAGLRLIQIRDKTLSRERRSRFAQEVVRRARKHNGVRVLINDDADLARETGADGLHLSSRELMASDCRPEFDLVGASCHDAEELRRAAELDLDFAVLSPVLPTASHPEAEGIGWQAFARLIEAFPLPVYALGGMRREMLETAREHGAHGIALLRNWR